MRAMVCSHIQFCADTSGSDLNQLAVSPLLCEYDVLSFVRLAQGVKTSSCRGTQGGASQCRQSYIDNISNLALDVFWVVRIAEGSRSVLPEYIEAGGLCSCSRAL